MHQAKMMMLQSLVNVVLAAASPEVLKSLVDGILDIIEDACFNSSNTIDDQLILPMCQKVRDVFGIPDNDFPEPWYPVPNPTEPYPMPGPIDAGGNDVK